MFSVFILFNAQVSLHKFIKVISKVVIVSFSFCIGISGSVMFVVLLSPIVMFSSVIFIEINPKYNDDRKTCYLREDADKIIDYKEAPRKYPKNRKETPGTRPGKQKVKKAV